MQKGGSHPFALLAFVLGFDYDLFMDKKDKYSIHTETTSDLPGLWGMSERILRRFKTVAFLLTLMPLVFLSFLCFGLAFTPGAFLFQYFGPSIENLELWQKALSYAFLLSASYIAFAVSIIFIVPLVNKLLPLKVKEVRGNWYSFQVIPWYYHNALTQLVRYTVLDIITPTPLTMLFFRMMGMKMGKNCVINTSNISDPCLIELGDYVTIGGSATVFAHYGMGGYLIISKTKIGSYSTIGLKASVMGAVSVGEKCVIKPHSVLLPKTEVPNGEVY